MKKANIFSSEFFFPDWTSGDSDLCAPIYDNFTKTFYTIVILSDTSTNDNIIKTQESDAKYRGISKLLKFYDKKEDLAITSELLRQNLITSQFYLDKRPNSKVQFLIGIPEIYFNNFNFNEETLKDIPNMDSSTLPVNWKTVHFNIFGFSDKIDIIAKRFKQYKKDISNWDEGELKNFDIEEEIIHLERFRSLFEQFLDYNDVSKNESRLIEIGFEGSGFNLKYVLVSDSKMEMSSPLRIGFNCFKENKTVLRERTLGYIFYHNEMVKDINSSYRNWLHFLTDYSSPLPEVKPSKTKKKEKELKKISTGKTVKTTEEKQFEDEQINNFDYQQMIHAVRKTSKSFVGDDLFSCKNIPIIMEKINSLEDLYSHVLNKINIADVATFVAMCVASKLFPIDICSVIFNRLPIEKMEMVLDFLPTEDVMEIQAFIGNKELGAKFDANGKVSVLREAIETVVSKEKLCEALNILDPDLFSNFLVDHFSIETFKLHNLLTITLPDNILTVDILSGIGRMIEEAIIEALSQVLLGMVKELFNSLCAVCNGEFGNQVVPQQEKNFGENNLNDQFDSNKYRRMVDDIFDGDEFFADEKNMGILSDFFDDVSAILTPNELCELLSGRSSFSVLELIRKLIDEKYKMFLSFASESFKILEFFEKIGNIVGLGICKEIEKRSNDNLCLEAKEKDKLRKNLLEGKMSSKQIQKQLEEEKERNKKKLESFVNLIDSNNSMFDDIIKNKTDGLRDVIFEEPSFKHMQGRVTDSSFDSVKSVLFDNIRGYISSIFNNREKTKSELLDFNEEELKKVYNIKLKPIEKLSQEDSNLLLKYYDATGLGGNQETALIIKPEIINNLKNDDNFEIDNSSSNSRLAINYNVSMPNFLEKLKEKREQKESQYKIETEKKKPVIDENTKYEISLMEPEVCNEPEIEIILATKILAENNIVQYAIDDKRERIILNSSGDDEFLFFDDKEKNINNLKDQFATIVANEWKKVVSSENIAPGTQLYNFFRDDAFESVTLNIVKLYFNFVSNSSFFEKKNIDNIEILLGIESDRDVDICETEVRDFWGFDNISEVISQEQKYIKGDQRIELSNRFGMTIFMLRIYAYEYLLRCIHLFTEMKMNSIVKRKLMHEYILSRIEKKIRNEKYYEDILTILKASVENKIKDLKEKEPQLYDEEDPEVLIGTRQLKYYLNKEIEFILSRIEKYFGTEETPGVKEVFMNELLATFDVVDSKDQSRFFMDDNLLKGLAKTNSNIDPNKPFLLYENMKDGELLLEKYVRMTNKNGQVVDEVVSMAEFRKIPGEFAGANKGKCGRIGMRLIYVPELVDGSKVQNIVKNENVSFNQDVVKREKLFDLENRRVFSFPLIAVEDEEEISYSDLSGLDNIENGKIGMLKAKMFEGLEFKKLFEELFSLENIVTVMMIYNIEILSVAIKNVDELFDGTKNMIKYIFDVYDGDQELWWKKDRVNNTEIRNQLMSNVKVEGPSVDLAGIAAMTVPLILKGVAAKIDPSYALIKTSGLPTNWGSVPAVLPFNIFPLIGFGPPLGPIGAFALSMPALSGERKEQRKKENEGKTIEEKEIECEKRKK